jgi:hypothetical protein
MRRNISYQDWSREGGFAAVYMCLMHEQKGQHCAAAIIELSLCFRSCLQHMYSLESLFHV